MSEEKKEIAGGLAKVGEEKAPGLLKDQQVNVATQESSEEVQGSVQDAAQGSGDEESQEAE